MELIKHNNATKPKPISSFKTDVGEWFIAYKNTNFLYTFVHFNGDGYTPNLFKKIKKLCEHNVDGYYTNYVCFYSPMQNTDFMELEKTHNNFAFYYMPLLTLGQLPYHIDIENLPAINFSFTKNYCCLNNRYTKTRYKVFKFLKDKNLTNHGYVSFRNVNRYYDGVNYKDQKIDKYVNFKDSHYTNEMTDNPRQHVCYYPVEDFLFDFVEETQNGEYPLVTIDKSIKPFLWGKIPVINACRYHMHFLEQIGFDIFSDIINYSYDLQKDSDLRHQMYIEQLEKLTTLNIDSISNLKDRLEKNRQNVSNLFKLSQDCYDDILANEKIILKNKDCYRGF